jgi:hypothetical protein
MDFVLYALGIVMGCVLLLIFAYALTKVATKAVLQARREFESQKKE